MKLTRIFQVMSVALGTAISVGALAQEPATSFNCEIISETGNVTLVRKNYFVPVIRQGPGAPSSTKTIQFSSGRIPVNDPYDYVGSSILARLTLSVGGNLNMNLNVSGNSNTPLETTAEAKLFLTGQNSYPVKGIVFKLSARPVTVAGGGYMAEPVRMTCTGQ